MSESIPIEKKRDETVGSGADCMSVSPERQAKTEKLLKRVDEMKARVRKTERA